MCCVCESSTLGLKNTYWLPHQWKLALKRAIYEYQRTGIKYRVHKTIFAGGKWGWVVSH